MRHLEAAAQQQVVRYLLQFHPCVLFTASTQESARNVRQAVRRKAMGYTAGTPDLMIFAARGGYHGLFLELKREKGGRVSVAQERFCAAAKEAGYCYMVAHGAQAAVDAISQYLRWPVEGQG